MSFPKNTAENIGKNIIKTLSGKYSQPRDHAAQFTTDVLKTTSKRVIQKTVETTGDLISNKSSDKITKASKNSQKSNSETITNDNDKEIHH